MRSTYWPPCLRANSQLNSAERTPPMCRKPVGDGAKRSRTLMSRNLVARLGALVGAQRHLARGEDHAFRQAELHLPRLQVRDHDHAPPDEHRRIGIARAQPGEDLPVAALA